MGQRVLILDDDTDLVESLVDLLSDAGCTCFSAASYGDLQRIPEDALAADLAILDINLGAGGPSGLDAYAWLHGRGFPGKIVFLTGHAHSHPLVRQAERVGHVQIFRKPIAPEALLTLAGEAPQLAP